MCDEYILSTALISSSKRISKNNIRNRDVSVCHIIRSYNKAKY